MQLLAILGRGIQRLSENSDPADVESWVLTEDLEVCDRDGAHLPVRVTANNNNPLCMVGGGELNLAAGIKSYHLACHSYVVCAYGGRSRYLEKVGGPSESEVMGKMLIEHGIPNKDVLIWPRDKTVPRPSNTGREILNIFELAIKKQCESVGIVTVGVHLPRTALYVSRHLRSARFSSLSVRFLESEEVLLTTTCSSPLSAMDVGDIHPPSGKLVARIAALRRSQAFQRTWKREELGIWRVLRGEYNDGKEGGNTTS